MKRLLIALTLACSLLVGCSGSNSTPIVNEPVQPASDTIIGFYFYYPGGSFSSPEYEITKTEDGFLFVGRHQPYGDFEVDIDEAALGELQDIIIEHDIQSWNGFDERAPEDEISSINLQFGIEILYVDGTVITARGDHAFPEGYIEAKDALIAFLNALAESN